MLLQLCEQGGLYWTDFFIYILLRGTFWRRKWQSTPVFFPGESCGQRSLVGCRSWGSRESDMTEATQHACMHWRRKWQPTPVFLPGESQGQRSLVGCCLWGCTELDTTEATQQQQQGHLLGFPGSSAGKDSWARKIPWRRDRLPTPVFLGFQVAQLVKNLLVIQETWVPSLGWEDPLEEGMAAHSSILAQRIPIDRGVWQATVHGVPKSWT